MAESLPKLRFRCPHCGGKLSVPADRAGRRGKCPRCREELTVPLAGSPSGVIHRDQSLPVGVSPRREAAEAPDPSSADLSLIPPVLDSALLDVPPTEAPQSEADESQEAYEQLRAAQGRYRIKDHEEPPQRKLPWIIDIFLYPFSVAGLTMLGITVGGPLLLRVLVFVMLAGTALFPPIVVFWVLAIVVNWVGSFLLLLYMNWYACECIRDSAQGNIRAAETAAITPGLGEIIGQTFRVLLCVLVLMAPAVVYATMTGGRDTIFWVLLGLGGFFMPMAWLAVTMFESITGLNPLLLLGSIGSTLLPYCLLVPFCYALIVLLPVAAYVVVVVKLPGYLLLFAAYYLWLVLAHLLGRFYWKYEERLNWAA